MEPKDRVKEELERLEVVAGNGLLDRRVFLRSGAAFAAAVAGYAVARSAGAAPLADAFLALTANSPDERV